MQMTAREAMHLTELRSQPTGHPVYRRVAQAMHERSRRSIRRSPRPSRTSRTTTSTWSAWRPSAGPKRSARPAGQWPTPAGWWRSSATATSRDASTGRARHRSGSPPRRSSTSGRSRSSSWPRASPCSPRRRARARRTARRWVPDLPPWGDQVTVRQLVHHTRGAPARRRTRGRACRRGVPPWGNATASLGLGGRRPRSDPGTGYAYTNHGLHAARRGRRARVRHVPRSPRSGIFAPLGHDRTRSSATPRRRCRSGRTRPLRGERRHDLRRAGAVPRGGRRRALDDRRRPRAMGRAFTTMRHRGSAPDGSSPGEPGRRHADPLRVGPVVRTHRGQPIHSHGGSFPGGRRRWSASPTAAHDRDRAGQPRGPGRLVLAFDRPMTCSPT